MLKRKAKGGCVITNRPEYIQSFKNDSSKVRPFYHQKTNVPNDLAFRIRNWWLTNKNFDIVEKEISCPSALTTGHTFGHWPSKDVPGVVLAGVRSKTEPDFLVKKYRQSKRSPKKPKQKKRMKSKQEKNDKKFKKNAREKNKCAVLTNFSSIRISFLISGLKNYFGANDSEFKI